MTKRIKEIRKLKKLLDHAEHLSVAQDLVTFLKSVGFNLGDIEGKLKDADELSEKIHNLAELPDRFNDHFADRGWILYGMLNTDVAQQAIHKAENDEYENAEKILVSHHDADQVEFLLKQITDLESFQPRFDLAMKAVKDYREERYHACVPVVLSLIDGMVNDAYNIAHGERSNFTAEDTDLTAFNSIAAHTRGLEKLQDLFLKGRNKTRKEEINIPYRNGIMHGMDLGYDNEVVAAKTWACLFSAVEWARKAEKDELDPPEEEESYLEFSWEETLSQIQKNKESRKKIEEWEPRDIEVGEDIPTSGKPEEYEEGSPERKLVEFLSYWEEENYGYMAECLWEGNDGGADPGELRERMEVKELDNFELLEVKDEAVALTEISVLLEYHITKDQKEEETLRLEKKKDGETVYSRDEGGRWWVIDQYRI